MLDELNSYRSPKVNIAQSQLAIRGFSEAKSKTALKLIKNFDGSLELKLVSGIMMTLSPRLTPLDNKVQQFILNYRDVLFEIDRYPSVINVFLKKTFSLKYVPFSLHFVQSNSLQEAIDSGEKKELLDWFEVRENVNLSHYAKIDYSKLKSLKNVLKIFTVDDLKILATQAVDTKHTILIEFVLEVVHELSTEERNAFFEFQDFLSEKAVSSQAFDIDILLLLCPEPSRYKILDKCSQLQLKRTDRYSSAYCVDFEGNTPLTKAIKHNDEKTVLDLLRNECVEYLFVSDRHGDTPIDLLVKPEYRALLQASEMPLKALSLPIGKALTTRDSSGIYLIDRILGKEESEKKHLLQLYKPMFRFINPEDFLWLLRRVDKKNELINELVILFCEEESVLCSLFGKLSQSYLEIVLACALQRKNYAFIDSLDKTLKGFEDRYYPTGSWEGYRTIRDFLQSRFSDLVSEPACYDANDEFIFSYLISTEVQKLGDKKFLDLLLSKGVLTSYNRSVTFLNHIDTQTFQAKAQDIESNTHIVYFLMESRDSYNFICLEYLKTRLEVFYRNRHSKAASCILKNLIRLFPEFVFDKLDLIIFKELEGTDILKSCLRVKGEEFLVDKIISAGQRVSDKEINAVYWDLAIVAICLENEKIVDLLIDRFDEVVQINRLIGFLLNSFPNKITSKYTNEQLLKMAIKHKRQVVLDSIDRAFYCDNLPKIIKIDAFSKPSFDRILFYMELKGVGSLLDLIASSRPPSQYLSEVLIHFYCHLSEPKLPFEKARELRENLRKQLDQVLKVPYLTKLLKEKTDYFRKLSLEERELLIKGIESHEPLLLDVVKEENPEFDLSPYMAWMLKIPSFCLAIEEKYQKELGKYIQSHGVLSELSVESGLILLKYLSPNQRRKALDKVSSVLGKQLIETPLYIEESIELNAQGDFVDISPEVTLSVVEGLDYLRRNRLWKIPPETDPGPPLMVAELKSNLERVPLDAWAYLTHNSFHQKLVISFIKMLNDVQLAVIVPQLSPKRFLALLRYLKDYEWNNRLLAYATDTQKYAYLNDLSLSDHFYRDWNEKVRYFQKLLAEVESLSIGKIRDEKTLSLQKEFEIYMCNVKNSSLYFYQVSRIANKMTETKSIFTEMGYRTSLQLQAEKNENTGGPKSNSAKSKFDLHGKIRRDFESLKKIYALQLSTNSENPEDDFMDVISWEIMEDPLFLPDSQEKISLDKSTILQTHNQKGEYYEPVNRKYHPLSAFKPNIELRKRIQDWRARLAAAKAE